MEHRPFYSIAPVSATYPEPEKVKPENRRILLVQGESVLFQAGSPQSSVLFCEPLPDNLLPAALQYLGHRDDLVYYAVDVPFAYTLPAGLSASPVRQLYGAVPDDDLALAAYAVRMVLFDRTTRFCGRCGKRTRALRTERARFCTDCNQIVYPRLSPAIIVLIRKGEEVLLARSPRFPLKIFSVLAGFVEPGENLEQAVHREVREEVGIEIKNIRYFGSEPWPFPDSLMIGFFADYACGDIVLDKNEIETAGWFTRENLPPLPSQTSISRDLIDTWIRREF